MKRMSLTRRDIARGALAAPFVVGTGRAAADEGSSVLGDRAKSDRYSSRRPNVLMVVIDDMSYVWMSAFGLSKARTPNMDRVANNGVLFEETCSGTPYCSVARASLLTGMHQWQMEEAGQHFSLFPRHLSVYPQLLAREGYQVGVTGKGWGPGNWRASGWEQNPAGPQFNALQTTPPASGIKKIDYAENFKAWLKDRDPDRPFAFWYGSFEGHDPQEAGAGLRLGMDPDRGDVPFDPEAPRAKRSDVLDFLLEIEWADRHLGLMLDALEDSGELDNTLVIVTSDNGGLKVPRAKGELYELGTRVPVAMMWRDVIPSGRRIADMIQFTDIAPTILDACGYAVPSQMAGASFMPDLVRDVDGVIDQDRRTAFSGQERAGLQFRGHIGFPRRAIMTPDHLLVWNLAPERYDLLVPDYAYPGFETRREEFELFDRNVDPTSANNIAGDDQHKETLMRLHTRLATYLKRTGDPRMTEFGDIFESYPFFGNPDSPYLEGHPVGYYNPAYLQPGQKVLADLLPPKPR